MGLAFKAIGQNMEAARTSGINPVFYRIVNFTLSCTIAGLLGGFYAHYYGVLTPELLHTSKTVEVLAVAYIGGRGSLWGGAFIAFPFMIAMELIRSIFVQPARIEPDYLRFAFDSGDDLLSGWFCALLRKFSDAIEKPVSALFPGGYPGVLTAESRAARFAGKGIIMGIKSDHCGRMWEKGMALYRNTGYK